MALQKGFLSLSLKRVFLHENIILFKTGQLFQFETQYCHTLEKSDVDKWVGMFLFSELLQFRAPFGSDPCFFRGEFYNPISTATRYL